MSKIEIYYFSGSGNSLHIAKELQERIPGSELIPIVSLLDNEVIETDADIVGFIFPIHGMTVPIPVKLFLKRLDANSAGYLFAIATRAGTWHNAFGTIDTILKKTGKRLDSYFTINMASNDPKFKDWKPATTEELARLESGHETVLDVIQRVIMTKENYRQNEDDEILYPAGFLIKRFALFGMFFMERTGANGYFYSDAKCAGCGTCEKVCPSRKVKMADKKPVWQTDVKCYFCYACVNYCPKKSVQIKSKIYMKSYTENNERYPHPYASINEIAGQKLAKTSSH